ncbi:hypothetical protein BIV60_12200 [Bacillus sp. MUM 116]|uniref:hypothetical protein n=1 Tax=Bacillus sp. MUM 116 TaxID=1678002 RepID=UPI0008F56BB7|nr:hypothetical protein [Bacillus sp. MUM 116]OIK14261.1 hypothetical protein BIV60_12200 [Bacillus sp. MUM 116]
MNVSIELHFISNENKVMRRGEFPLRRKRPEEVAFEFWKQIKREMPFGGELVRVKASGEDITELVMELEKAPLKD